MVLNHVSLLAPDEHDVTGWLVGVAQGIATLTKAGIAENTLRLHRNIGDVQCRPSHSLADAFQSLRVRERDAYLFLVKLVQKVPLSQGLAPDTAGRLLACENMSPEGEDGDPLLLCAITGAIAVGFPSSPEWDRDQLLVTFEELLLPDGELNETEETVDNLARTGHARAILRRHQDRRRAGVTASEVWAHRRDAFPNLLFGPQVEDQLMKHERLLPQVVGKLAALDDAVRNWDEGPAPNWQTRVTPESERVINTPKLHDARMFESEKGGRKPFLWHARAGNGYRLHFRFDGNDRSLEVGYIGPHLPTK